MPPSGKIAGPFCAVLNAAAVLSLAFAFALKDPIWPPAIADVTARVSSAFFKPNAAQAVATDQAPSALAVEAPQPGNLAKETEKPVEAAFRVPPLSWTHVQVEAALMQCLGILAPINAEIVPLAPLAYGGCGTPAPVLLRSLGSKDKVTFDPPLVLNCQAVVALDRWLTRSVQPAARANLGSPVARVMASSYACRTPYNLPSDKLSQHAFGNAVDLPIFVLADGRMISVTKGWGPAKRDLVVAAKPKLVPVVAKTEDRADAAGEKTPPKKPAGTSNGKSGAEATPILVKASASAGLDDTEDEPSTAAPEPDARATPQAKFLRQVHRAACDTFSTVLGPEANDVHRTHLHLDLQDRDTSKVCR